MVAKVIECTEIVQKPRGSLTAIERDVADAEAVKPHARLAQHYADQLEASISAAVQAVQAIPEEAV